MVVGLDSIVFQQPNQEEKEKKRKESVEVLML